ncbi:hypothetical protein [Allocoleopsis franciscana]|uniref:Uncharacterized protein n=1 Tax=Allocoleopsis franciscana PCC 7113 TaxID=1173027 RepID=K9WRF0_9CYAN|nr:hypothetical protein [Allocoleopsis franciscana]AFZ22366.1 hypothetical protein Mic7113_6809 [Allocoleopsis franciscana PCC 7113]
MATLTPGTGGTLKSTTLENGFHEALSRVALAEQDITKDTQVLTRVTMSNDVRASRITGTFTFALTKETTSAGSTSFIVADHLTNSGYAAGTGGTIKSATLPAAIVEIAEALQSKEQITSKNSSNINTITGLTYDSETLLVSGSFDYSTVATMSASGELTVSAKTYLTD